MQHRDEAIHGQLQRGEIEDDVELVFAQRDHEPQFHFRRGERIGDLRDEVGVVVLIGGIELLPVEDQAAGLGLLQSGHEFADEARAFVGGAVGEIFHGLRLPGVALQIVQDRHQREPVGGGESDDPRLDLHDEPAVGPFQRKPFGREVRERARVLFQRGKAVRIPIDIQPEPDFAARVLELRANAGEAVLRGLRGVVKSGDGPGLGIFRGEPGVELKEFLLKAQRVGIVLFLADRDLELAFERAHRGGHVQLGVDEKRAEKPHHREQDERRPEGEHAPQPRPALAMRILENEPAFLRVAAGFAHRSAQANASGDHGQNDFLYPPVDAADPTFFRVSFC